METINTKRIIVVDVNGRLLNPCTIKQANQTIVRKRAEWIFKNQAMQLFTNRNILHKERCELIKQSKRVCYICGKKVPLSDRCTFDHKCPTYKNGTEDKINGACCCLTCNGDKASRDYYEYVMYIYNNRLDYPYISDARLKYLLIDSKMWIQQYIDEIINFNLGDDIKWQHYGRCYEGVLKYIVPAGVEAGKFIKDRKANKVHLSNVVKVNRCLIKVNNNDKFYIALPIEEINNILNKEDR